MAPLCASNQTHSVYPHISPPDPSLSALPPIYISATVLHSSGPEAGPFIGLLVEVSINLSVIRQAQRRKGPHCHQKVGDCQQTGGSLIFVMRFRCGGQRFVYV